MHHRFTINHTYPLFLSIRSGHGSRLHGLMARPMPFRLRAHRLPPAPAVIEPVNSLAPGAAPELLLRHFHHWCCEYSRAGPGLEPYLSQNSGTPRPEPCRAPWREVLVLRCSYSGFPCGHNSIIGALSPGVTEKRHRKPCTFMAGMNRPSCKGGEAGEKNAEWQSEVEGRWRLGGESV